jgi:hypothetical protein
MLTQLYKLTQFYKLTQLDKFTFNKSNINNGYLYRFKPTPLAQAKAQTKVEVVSVAHVEVDAETETEAEAEAEVEAEVEVEAVLPKNELFTPYNKDKLFWCFFIILKGHEVYELNRSNAFTIEKEMKINAVEKLISIKDKLKELKLKRTELEDEFVNKQVISVKGLTALCLIYDISITYIFGRKFCEINPTVENKHVENKHIIIQNAKKEDSLQYGNNFDNKDEYWFIENIQKPLNAPSAYTIKDLQTICERLQIDINTTVNEKTKLKNKKQLYEEILQHL